MDDGRQLREQQRVIDTTHLPAIKIIGNHINMDKHHLYSKNSRKKDVKNDMTSSTTNHLDLSGNGRGQQPEVLNPVLYPLSPHTTPLGCQNGYDDYQYQPATRDARIWHSPKTNLINNINSMDVDQNLILQSFNQNAATSDTPTGATTSDYPDSYLENYHDLASCSCDMDCFHQETEPETRREVRTSTRHEGFLPYLDPTRYKTVPPNSHLPTFRRTLVPYPWGAPTENTRRAANQTKYPVPTLTYPYTFMSQFLFKHYELNEKTDSNASQD